MADCGDCQNELPPGWNYEACPGDCNTFSGSSVSQLVCEMKFELSSACFLDSDSYQNASQDYVKDWCKCSCDNCGKFLSMTSKMLLNVRFNIEILFIFILSSNLYFTGNTTRPTFPPQGKFHKNCIRT